MYKFKYFLAIALFIPFLFLFVSCSVNEKDYLDTPINLSYDSSSTTISWDKVDDAIGYEVLFNEDRITTKDTVLNILYLFVPDKKYDVSVCAIAKDEKYNSNYSDSIYVTLESTEGLSYKLNENGLGYSVSKGNINFYQLPEIIIMKDSYNGLPVVAIDDYGFSIQSIDKFPFNTTVKKIRLSNNLIKTGKACFLRIVKLENIILPEGLEELSDATFSSCQSLKNIKLPKSLKKIGTAVFSACGLTEITIPNVEIGNGIFSGCENLKKIEFPNGISTIPNSCCSNDINLEEIILPESLESIEYAAFMRCVKLKTIVIPDNVKCIGDRAFFECENLENITFPLNIDYVGGYAFEKTKWFSLKDGPIQIDGILIGYNNMPENFEFVVPSNIRIIAKGSLLNQNNLLSVTVPATVKTIETFAFCNCANLKNVTIEANIEEISAYMFRNCKKLEYVKLPESIKTIATCAFENCTNLTKINVPTSLEIIESSAFSLCIALKSFDLARVKKIGNYAFFNVGFEFLKIENDLLGDTFSSPMLTSVVIGKNVTNMPILDSCTALQSVFYEGTVDEYKSILRENYDTVNKFNSVLNATIYYYSDTEPTNEGNYWRYVNGEITIW